MVNIIQLNNLNSQEFNRDIHDQFKQDIKAGLEKKVKQISPKYLYDDRGCKLFNQITRHPDYYPSRSEIDILQKYKHEISAQISAHPFNLVELGPGEGIKTEILINQFMQNELTFSYVPIDINVNYLKSIFQKIESKSPNLQCTAIHADYFAGLDWLRNHSKRRNIVLFLGSSIGNFNITEAEKFLLHLHTSLNQDDLVLIGFDLIKDKNTLMRAYNDSDGLTTQFNLNILRRINEELGANFNLSKFKHHPTYNTDTDAMESYLISLEKQRIDISELNQSFNFAASEPIHIESSHKYQLSLIESLARKYKFKLLHHFIDSRQFFVDSLLRV